MKRLLPNSLLGQVLLVTAIGLLIGQVVAGVMLYRASEQRREAGAVNQIAARVVSADQVISERRALREAMRAERGLPPLSETPDRVRRPRVRAGGVEQRAASPLSPGEQRQPRIEAALEGIFKEQGFASSQIVAAIRRAGDDPEIAVRPRLRERLDANGWAKRQIIVAGIERADGQGWTVVRQPLPGRPSGVVGTIVVQTLVIFAVLFALLYFVLRRMTRPLAQLTTRVSDFSENPDQAIRLEERGPADMRRLIAAHNAMEMRIASLIDEKDVMLGAIGHDLKTPLAALRVRIESVQDDVNRSKMAQSIEDITRTLDDILELARVGRPGEQLESTDLSALIASVAAEYEDMGRPVVVADNPRIALPLRPTLLRRAVRNLIDNALRYGKTAAVSVNQKGSDAIICIEDEGPGIPAQQISAMLEPFQRGEASRNRKTGGAGLGLTLARAIAEQHGGLLTLTNRPEGGLRAEIRLPLA
ncbi:MAG: two-component sensor histidine kinase [Altererythrobacter sp.]|nr:two-component sensor histidine kinase [Altererythrobacter sp.]